MKYKNNLYVENYLVDLGLRYALLGKEFAANVGHLLENIIFLELHHRNSQVWIGKTDNFEVDFVVRDKNDYTKKTYNEKNSSHSKRSGVDFERLQTKNNVNNATSRNRNLL